jgi:GTP-binding protein HflX
LSDTVGFIRKLPTQLVESFKSTLDEVRESDIIIHVADISNSSFEDHINVVNKTLEEIKASDKPTILVFNKIDAFEYKPKHEDDLTPYHKNNYSLHDLENTWMKTLNSPCVFISAQSKLNIESFKDMVYDAVKKVHLKKYPNYL